MQFDQYKNLLIEKIRKQLSDWFDNRLEEQVPREELYRFLHSIKGTAGTIQLGGILQITAELLDRLDQNSDPYWSKSDLRDFLYHLLRVSYEYEHYKEESGKTSKLPREGKVPLIQIIDEDVSMLILLREALGDKGWLVIVHNDFKKGKEQFLELKPDCLIIDRPFTKSNEFDSFVQFQKTSFVPLVVTSIDQDRKSRMEAYQKGADDYIEKPLNLEELVIRIERLLQRKELFDQNFTSISKLTQPVQKRLNVSVLDDDPIIRTMLIKVLQSIRIDHIELNIQAFDDGKKFLESNWLKEQGEHFIVLDGVMPVMDGIEVLQKVKQRKEKVSVLMLTARKSEHDIARALQLGADDYVTKPFSILELQARMERLIQRMF
ncbi:response regulator [Pseudoneobacillus sp. C159]